MKTRFLHEDPAIKPLALVAFTVGAALAVTVALSWPEPAPPTTATPVATAHDAFGAGVPALPRLPRLDAGVDWSKVETATDPGPEEMPTTEPSTDQTTAETWPDEVANPEPWPE